MTFIGRFTGTTPANNGDLLMEAEKRALSVNEFCRRYGVGRTTAYAEIKAGRLNVVKSGKRTLVPADEAESWLSNLPTAQKAASRHSRRRPPACMT
jgi:excisionase family DNA binding protein